MRKGKKCSLSMEELFQSYQPHPLVTKVAAILRKMPGGARRKPRFGSGGGCESSVRPGT